MKYNTKSPALIQNIYQKFFYGLCKRHFYYITSPFRILSDFFVIGVVRSGTTSLFHYLGQHPSIKRAAYDELGYFDDNYHLGINWYKSLFPTKFTKNKIINKTGTFLTFDVTPFYIYNSLVVRRILQCFPKSKIIATLRNPIDRAYSNYIIALQEGDIDYSFEEAVKLAVDEIDESKSKLNNEAYLVNKFYENILSRGFYANQLKTWYAMFPKNKLLMVSSENLAKNTDNALREIFEFLDLPYYKIADLTKQNKRKYQPMKEETRKFLIEYFKPYNEDLYKLIDRHFDWDK